MPSDSLRTSLVRYSSAAETLKSTGISKRLPMPEKSTKGTDLGSIIGNFDRVEI